MHAHSVRRFLALELECLDPQTLLKSTSQICCIDHRCAIPCDKEVPCMIAFLGLTCVKHGECACVCGERVVNPTSGKWGAPPAAVMSR